MTQDAPRPPIPIVRLNNEAVWEALEKPLKELVLEGRFTLGPELEEFERSAARQFGCDWCVGTSSGTSALFLALKAAPLEPRSRVAIPASTFFATLEAVVTAGHIPVVIDQDQDHLIDLTILERCELDAVIPVHLFGLPVDMAALKEIASDKGWWVLEDCAQAAGASISGKPVGSQGDAGAFSAYPTKNLGAWGDAGFVTTDDGELAARIKALRHHGQAEANVHAEIGGTDRLDNLQALVLTEKLRHLSREVEERRAVATGYVERLSSLGLDLPQDRADRRHVFHQFAVRVPDRTAIRARMSRAGIATAVHYPTPVHLQPGAQGRCDVPYPTPMAEISSTEILGLPIFPGLSADEVDRVATGLRLALRRKPGPE